MSTSIGRPTVDCDRRRSAADDHVRFRKSASALRGISVTYPNGEETRFSLTYALNYHKALPHDPDGFVHRASYEAMVRMLTGEEHPAFETLPVGENRRPGSDDVNPPRYAVADGDTDELRGYRKQTSPFAGHVFDTQGADAGDFAMPPAPLAAFRGSPENKDNEKAKRDVEELAAEMAEVYVMALLRDQTFNDIAAPPMGSPVEPLLNVLKEMSWFNGTFEPRTEDERRRFEGRVPLVTSADLFVGSTPGSREGPLLSQFMLMGNANTGFTFASEVPHPNGETVIGGDRPAEADGGEAMPGGAEGSDGGGAGEHEAHHAVAQIEREDGYVLYGTQVIDQRNFVAKEELDFLTNWAAWLDCQNGVNFGSGAKGFKSLDVIQDKRRFIATPRDLATYVHFDALYQGYHVACLLMLADPMNFPKDRGMPETTSRTRDAFSTFGGPHILSLVTEVATRALKAVWRHKWLYHRRARPEVVAALLTLQANDPNRITCPQLQACLQHLLETVPPGILQAVADHNTEQKAKARIVPKEDATTDPLPTIEDNLNYLLPMAFPEGSPTHPAYGAGHATVAGACVTILKAFFEMYDDTGKHLREWPYEDVFIATKGKELSKVDGNGMTIEGELDKLAANIAIGRNMAGVHYYTDYFESLRLGERIAVSILEEQMPLYGETVSMSFTSFDGDRIRISANRGEGTVRVLNGGNLLPATNWYHRYAA